MDKIGLLDIAIRLHVFNKLLILKKLQVPNLRTQGFVNALKT